MILLYKHGYIFGLRTQLNNFFFNNFIGLATRILIMRKVEVKKLIWN